MVIFNDKYTIYHFIRVAENCPEFDIDIKYLPMILEEDFEKEYPNMLCDIFSKLTIAYYQGYGY